MNFSVVISLHNKEKYIQRCLFSVINQTYKNYEILVVNDGSTDNSVEKVTELKIENLRIINQENLGASSARNKGVAEASNEWIAFIDGDDEWKPTFLEEIYCLAQTFPSCGVYATSYLVVENGKTSSPVEYLPYQPGWKGIIEDLYRDFRIFNPFNSSSVVVNKKYLDDVGGFPVGVREGEDNITWLKLFQETKIAFYNFPLSIYHKEAENRTCSLFSNRIEQYPPVTYLFEQLEKGNIPPKFERSVQEYIAKHQIIAARRNLLVGDNIFARKLLWTCNNTALYRRKWLTLYLYSLLPIPVYKWISNFKERTRNFRNSLKFKLSRSRRRSAF